MEGQYYSSDKSPVITDRPSWLCYQCDQLIQITLSSVQLHREEQKDDQGGRRGGGSRRSPMLNEQVLAL